MKLPRLRWLGLLGLGVATLTLAEAGYYRHPAAHGDTLVFTAEGDLWAISLNGGPARRLTTHPAEESQAAISPDGRRIAFAANYDGATEAYVMPIDGGAPVRVSFEGGRIGIAGWTPRGEVVYATDNLAGPSWRTVLRTVDPDTLERGELPLADANEAAFDDAGHVYFTRFGLHITGDNAREYRGGAMAQLWRFALDGKGEAVRLAADHPGALKRPMWWQGRLYFVSDAAGGTDNLWSMDADGGDIRQHTRHADFEVRGARLADGRIVYQHGADLRVYDIASGHDRIIDISLASDFVQRRERWIKQPLAFLTSAGFAPDGERVVLTARGRVALAGTGPLRRIEIALPAEQRARNAVLSPDGKWVYAIADGTGEHEVWRFPADGSPGGEPLTRDGDSHRWRVLPSPDGQWLAHDDKRGRLWLLELATGRNVQIDALTPHGGDQYSDIVWSPDSRFLALVRPHSPRRRDQVLLYSLAERRLATITSDRYESFSPAFTPDGQWLYFLSNRNFQPTPGAPWGDRNMGPAFDKRAKAYAVALRDGLRFPFRPKDELGGNGKAGGDGKKDGTTPMRIDWDGLASRLHEVPLAPGNYRNLQTDGERLYLLDAEAGPEPKPTLKTLAIAGDAPQPEVFMAEVRDYALSADRKKLWLMKWTRNGPAGDMFILPAGAKAPTDAAALAKAQVRVGDWSLPILPAREWRQMFADAWRMHRDFLFDPNMRGLDWPALRDKYAPLLERVADRGELDDLLGQMMGELGVLHSQVRGSDLRRDAEAAVAASLGAAFERVADGARIARVWRSDAELPNERAPLAQPGVELREGDVVLAVNGRPVKDAADIAVLLANQAGQQVLIDYRRGNAAPARVVATPVAMDRDATLRYGDWVQGTRERVEQAGGGRIGYLHLRAMTAGDVADFAREFYANVDREALIVDVRRNRGGNIDSWVIEKLLRRAWMFWQPPGRSPYPNMQQTFRGHLVVLIDNLTYSDGETFAAGIKSLGLAPLIGQRTAGAGVWLSDRNRLSDNGMVRAAENAQFAPDGRWLIEGRGVAPDIEVDNPPHATWRGEDAQLAAALAHLERKLREQPIVPFQGEPIPPRGRNGADVR